MAIYEAHVMNLYHIMLFLLDNCFLSLLISSILLLIHQYIFLTYHIINKVASNPHFNNSMPILFLSLYFFISSSLSFARGGKITLRGGLSFKTYKLMRQIYIMRMHN